MRRGLLGWLLGKAPLGLGQGGSVGSVAIPAGVIWTIQASAADNAWRSVAYGNGRFVAAATSGTGDRVMTSRRK